VAVHGFGGSRRGTTARRSRIRKNARCRIHENKVACFRGTYKVTKDGLQAIAEPHLWGKSKTSQFTRLTRVTSLRNRDQSERFRELLRNLAGLMAQFQDGHSRL
jgi:hypothetical protein